MSNFLLHEEGTFYELMINVMKRMKQRKGKIPIDGLFFEKLSSSVEVVSIIYSQLTRLVFSVNY